MLENAIAHIVFRLDPFTKGRLSKGFVYLRQKLEDILFLMRLMEDASSGSSLSTPAYDHKDNSASEKEPIVLHQRPVWTEDNFRFVHPTRTDVREDVKIFGDHHIIQEKRKKVPPAYIAEIQNALVFGQAMCVFRGSDLIQLSADTDISSYVENYSRYFDKKDDGYFLVSNPEIKESRCIDQGCLIGGRYAKNYFHWLIEYMPRVLIAREHSLHPPYITNDVPPQARELLECFGQSVFIEDGEILRVDRLTVPMSPSFAPDNANHARFSVYDDRYLMPLRKELYKIYALPEHHKADDIVFIERRGSHGRNIHGRNIINEDEVRSFVLGKGGRVIVPNALSMREQMEVFSRAKIVVGAGGAGFANLLFCKPGTAAIVLHRDRLVNPSYFRPLADAVGANLVSVAGRVDAADDDNAHALFSIDIGNLEAAFDHVSRQ